MAPGTRCEFVWQLLDEAGQPIDLHRRRPDEPIRAWPADHADGDASRDADDGDDRQHDQ
jgi:hypothetical protein